MSPPVPPESQAPPHTYASAASAVGSSPFLQACQGQIPDRRPIWLMRQAGRILEPYRKLKDSVGSIETLFTTPELAAEVTLMPVQMLGVDAAILFADIFTPVIPMGYKVEFSPAPRMPAPLRQKRDVEALRQIDSETDLSYVLETIRLALADLPAGIPLIGFAGAPFTLACYLAEGGGAREFTHFPRLIKGDAATAHALMRKLTETAIDYLSAQVRAGVAAVQLFDTGIGTLAAPMFEAFAKPYVHEIFDCLGSEFAGVPRIYYANSASHLTGAMEGIGADVLSLDWRVDLPSVYRHHSGRFVVQGNLDPCAMFGAYDQISSDAHRLLAATEGIPHIFNLGHGVLPETSSGAVRHLVDVVHRYVAGQSRETE